VRRMIVVALALSALAILLPLGITSVAGQDGDSAPGRMVALRASGRTQQVYTPPPTQRVAQAATFTVNYDAGFNANASARAAFQYAVDIWAGQITSSVPIVIDASFRSLEQGVLGSAGASRLRRDFPNAPVSGTWYPIALANRHAGFDLDTTAFDIAATFSNNNSTWYYGTDGNTPSGKYDFVSVVLHEIGHGLGFSGSADYTSGIGTYGDGTSFAEIYDRFVFFSPGGQTVTGNFTANQNSATLGSLLTGNAMYWNGTNGIAGAGGTNPRLYAPSTWQGGSSYSHLNEDTYPAGNADSLMTPSISSGEAIHNPGPIARGMFQDMGWAIDAGSTATPTRTHTPTVTPTVTHTATSTRTPTATTTPVPTVAIATPASLPTSIATPDPSTGGVAYVVPTVTTGGSHSALISISSNSPFNATLLIPAPGSGESALGVRAQPSTSLSGVSLPSGVTVTKALAIDIFNPTSGALTRSHQRPLTLALTLSSAEQTLCASDPGLIALLHYSGSTLERIGPSRLDCAVGILEVRVTSTSSYAVATLTSSQAITIKSFVPISLRASSGV